jgi:hypothetical protein
MSRLAISTAAIANAYAAFGVGLETSLRVCIDDWAQRQRESARQIQLTAKVNRCGKRCAKKAQTRHVQASAAICILDFLFR